MSLMGGTGDILDDARSQSCGFSRCESRTTRVRFSVRIDGGLEPALGVRIRRFHHYKKKFYVTGMFPDPYDFEALLVLGQEEMDDDPFPPIDCEVQEMIFEFERKRLLHLQDYLLDRIQRAGYVLKDEDEIRIWRTIWSTTSHVVRVLTISLK